MQHLPICLLQYIFDKLNLKSQIRFMQTCKKHNTLRIKTIYKEWRYISIVPLDFYKKLNLHSLYLTCQNIHIDIPLIYGYTCNGHIALYKRQVFLNYTRYNINLYINLFEKTIKNIYENLKKISDNVYMPSYDGFHIIVFPQFSHMSNLKVIHVYSDCLYTYLQNLNLKEIYVHFELFKITEYFYDIPVIYMLLPKEYIGIFPKGTLYIKNKELQKEFIKMGYTLTKKNNKDYIII